jgi:hypothetical protein
MVQEAVAWFPQYKDVPVSVSSSPLAASYSVSGQPGGFAHGQTASYQVTVTNTGTTTWTAGGSTPFHLGIHFAAGSGGYPTSGPWATDQRFALPSDVTPGQSVTLSVSVTAPGSAGPYILEYELVQESVAWFKQYLDNPVSVT